MGFPMDFSVLLRGDLQQLLLQLPQQFQDIQQQGVGDAGLQETSAGAMGNLGKSWDETG